MARRSMSARISPTMLLDRIVIELDPFGALPTVRLEGRVETRKPSVGLVSEASITTRHLGASGEAWINEMREAFAAASTHQPARKNG